MNYIDVLNDKKVIDCYNKIDEVNQYPFNHGLKHIKNVCKIMDKLTDSLGIDGEEKGALLIACSLHDIGQVDGRKCHGKKAKQFVIDNYSDVLGNNKYYKDILFAIEIHDYDGNPEESLFSVLVKFCDKMDFTKDRLEDDYMERFGYCCFQEISDINFINDDTYFGIDIITDDVDTFEDDFFSYEFTGKVFNCVDLLALKLNKDSIVKHNGKEISYAIHKQLKK